MVVDNIEWHLNILSQMMHQYDRQCEKFRSKCKDLRVEKLRMRKSHHRRRQLHRKFSNQEKLWTKRTKALKTQMTQMKETLGKTENRIFILEGCSDAEMMTTEQRKVKRVDKTSLLESCPAERKLRVAVNINVMPTGKQSWERERPKLFSWGSLLY